MSGDAPEDPLKVLSDLASDAHALIQQNHAAINPVVEVRRGMRDNGIPADAMTIDCLNTRRRILLILHDGEPGLLLYNFGSLDEEAGVEFERKPLRELTVTTLHDWMRDYFREGRSH
ncbi:MAG: hypothetical protein R3296_00335 [Oleiphilaceae bacterium]|nr:hypothetical protein [Oleiphilaceae bacterium]